MFDVRLDEGGKALFTHVGDNSLVEASVLLFYDEIETIISIRLFGKSEFYQPIIKLCSNEAKFQFANLIIKL